MFWLGETRGHLSDWIAQRWVQLTGRRVLLGADRTITCSGDDLMTAELEIRNATEALRSAVNGGDIAGILACWAPDGVLLPPHHPLVRGHAAIAAFFVDVFAARRLTFTFTDSVITIDEDLAIERLTFTAHVTAVRDGTTTEDVGKGVHIYARQKSGGWKLVQDIWNSDRALPAPSLSSSASTLATREER